jgi:hypothetical protein
MLTLLHRFRKRFISINSTTCRNAVKSQYLVQEMNRVGRSGIDINDCPDLHSYQFTAVEATQLERRCEIHGIGFLRNGLRDHLAGIQAHVTDTASLPAGCLQDFVYPEQLKAAVQLMADLQVTVEFPMDQSCCGLPVEMMGEKEAAVEVAWQNVRAFNLGETDYIVTLCASCAYHLKKRYPQIIGAGGRPDAAVSAFSAKVMPFSLFLHDVLKIPAEIFQPVNQKVTFHAPCHLCRGLGVTEAPHRLIQTSGVLYLPRKSRPAAASAAPNPANFPKSRLRSWPENWKMLVKQVPIFW